MKTSLVTVSAVALFCAACGGAATPEQKDEPLAQTSQDLFSQSGDQHWNQTIPICFWQSPDLHNDHTREINIIRAAIQRTWLRAANIPVTWNGNCTSTGGSQLRILLGNHTCCDGSTDGQTGSVSGGANEGMNLLVPAGTPFSTSIFSNTGMRVWVQDNGGSEQSKLE